jgi:hypothetical protein
MQKKNRNQADDHMDATYVIRHQPVAEGQAGGESLRRGTMRESSQGS